MIWTLFFFGFRFLIEPIATSEFSAFSTHFVEKVFEMFKLYLYSFIKTSQCFLRLQKFLCFSNPSLITKNTELLTLLVFGTSQLNFIEDPRATDKWNCESVVSEKLNECVLADFCAKFQSTGLCAAIFFFLCHLLKSGNWSGNGTGLSFWPY